MISSYGYQATVALIAISLVVSPAWIRLVKHLLDFALPVAQTR